MKILRTLSVLCAAFFLFTACDASSLTGITGNADASLSSLTVTAGDLSPAFDSEQLSYTVTAASGITQVRITASPADESATLAVNGSNTEPGKPSYCIQLTAENNLIPVKVKASDGETIRVYSVNVVKTTAETVNTVVTPQFSLPDGTTFTSSLVVSMICATSGASIYYTIDGTTPTSSSALYSAPITLSATTTLKMFASKSGMNNSAVASAAYTKSVLQQVESPAFDPAGGTTFTGSQIVSLSCPTSAASIYYTTDGATPSASSSLYSSSITLSATTTLKAIAIKSGMNSSAVVSAVYTKTTAPVETVSDPVFSPVSGATFSTTQTVTITSATSGASIYYTTNGTAPTSASTLYSAALTLSATTTVNAVAIKSGMTNSCVVAATFTYTGGGNGGSTGTDLETAYYKTNPNGQVGKYKSGMSVTCTSMKSEGFTDWSSDMIIAQGAANDVAQSFFGSHEAPIYDTYALYAAWDDTNLYLGWQYVNVVDVTDPAQGYPISDNGKPWNGDIRVTLAFDTDSSKSSAGVLTDGVTGVWEATGKWYNHFDNGMDILMNFSSKPGVGTPGVFYPNASGQFTYTDTSLCKTFSTLGIVYGYVDGLLPSTVYGVNKPGSWAGYTPEMLLLDTGFTEFLAAGHSSSHDTFYEMKIPLTALNTTRASLESTGIGVMLVSTFGCSAIGSIPYDASVYDNVTSAYSADASTSAEKNDVDVFTCKLARIGHK